MLKDMQNVAPLIDQLDEQDANRFQDYLLSRMNYWQTYSQHKEKMYITITTIFVAGSFAGAS
jgi:hypothetical protein